MKTIDILVSPEGDTEVRTNGFAGATCKEATKLIEAALGKVVRDQPTAESFTVQQQTFAKQENLE